MKDASSFFFDSLLLPSATAKDIKTEEEEEDIKGETVLLVHSSCSCSAVADIGYDSLDGFLSMDACNSVSGELFLTETFEAA